MQEHLEPETYWEMVGETTWGTYITGVKNRGVLKAHHMTEHPGQALEIGCEGGRWSFLLSQLGWTMTCTDIDLDSLDMCQKRVPGARCIHVNPNDSRLPCGEGMNLVLWLEVVEVIQSEWLAVEAFRVLNTGGLLVGIFYNLISFRGLYYRFANTLKSTNCADYKHPYQGWRRKLCQTGFSMIHEEGFCWFPFKRDSNSPLVPTFIRLEQNLGLHRMISASP